MISLACVVGCLHSLVRTVASVAKHEIMAASQPLNAPKEGCKQGRIQGGRMRGCVPHQRLVADWYFRIFATFMRNVACKNWQSSTKKMYSSSPNLLPVPWPRWELRTQTQSSLTDNFWIYHWFRGIFRGYERCAIALCRPTMSGPPPHLWDWGHARPRI